MRGCEAEIHDDRCPCKGCKRDCATCPLLTRDHFSPRSILKTWGEKPKTINRRENIQMLSKYCHRLKDESTPQRLQMLRRQLRGATVTLEDYREFRNKEDLRFK